MKYKYLITKEGHIEIEHGEIQSDKEYNEVYDSLLKEALEKHGECFLELHHVTEFPRYERHYTQLFA